ncbi:MAG: mechanosensitive ion channel [Alphaproteobacteria bacterium]|nr:mechanosensitive ion channel [Alphaproteobacteria bacterium]MBL6951609.1 mechanosensitive ion channel [Alphaproteobacteria bacterium]
MDRFVDTADLHQIWQVIQMSIKEHALNIGNAEQLAVVAAAFVLALFMAPPFRRGVSWLSRRRGDDDWLARTGDTVSGLALPIIWLCLQWISGVVAEQADWPRHLLTITVSLLTAWIVIRLAASLIREPAIAKAVSITAWTVAALNILGLLDPTIMLLDDLALHMGQLRISVLTVIKGVIALGVLVWAAMLMARVTEQRISSLTNLTPSVRVLLTKLVKIVLVTVAVVVAISSVGIDLTAFAVFGGALGVGIGLGLQKSVANLISGVLILLDKSVKPGDVIEAGGTYGQVKSLGGRYASVITRDGVEHLIPNEELISQRVSNWSYSSNEVRLRLPVGVSYSADVRKAMQLMHDAANEVDRVLAQPPAAVLIKGFGDSSVDLELRFWIDDPMNGLANVKSAILLKIWDKFQEQNIEIPFPQRDMHIKTTMPSQNAD